MLLPFHAGIFVAESAILDPATTGLVMPHEVTPFELSFRHEIDEDYVHMANGWFFKWHSINIPNRVVDVEDFFGGRFHVGGIMFQGQIQDLYWRSVGKHLIDRVHRGFQQWEMTCATYPANLKGCALDALEGALLGYTTRIIEKATETDRALRGRGDPSSVQPYNGTGHHSRANLEILRLKQAHAALLPKVETKIEKPSRLKKIEEHFAKWRGVYAGIGLLIAVVGLIAKLIF
jgi:hypothetical protein